MDLSFLQEWLWRDITITLWRHYCFHFRMVVHSGTGRIRSCKYTSSAIRNVHTGTLYEWSLAKPVIHHRLETIHCTLHGHSLKRENIWKLYKGTNTTTQNIYYYLKKYGTWLNWLLSHILYIHVFICLVWSEFSLFQSTK
jgi:hypothetical protein